MKKLITFEGRRHFGAAPGSSSFTGSYISSKTSKWVKEIDILADTAPSQPQAAHAAFTHGLTSKWAHFKSLRL